MPFINWKKLHLEGYILCDSMLYNILEKAKLLQQEADSFWYVWQKDIDCKGDERTFRDKNFWCAAVVALWLCFLSKFIELYT